MKWQRKRARSVGRWRSDGRSELGVLSLKMCSRTLTLSSRAQSGCRDHMKLYNAERSLSNFGQDCSPSSPESAERFDSCSLLMDDCFYSL